MKVNIIKAAQKDICELARLFDLYRQFYGCEPNLSLAKEFISERMNNAESELFLAVEGDNVIGFTQLYPSFCSVDAVRIYILYDLYVDECARSLGVGEALMNKATEFSKQSGSARIDLLTANDNKAGQHLYEKLGYNKVNENFFAYSLNLTN